MVDPGDLILQCGAHHGIHTLLLARRVGAAGHVWAVEAHPGNAGILRQNLSLNGLANVDVIEAAIGGSNGLITIDDNSNSRIVLRKVFPAKVAPLKSTRPPWTA